MLWTYGKLVCQILFLSALPVSLLQILKDNLFDLKFLKDFHFFLILYNIFFAHPLHGLAVCGLAFSVCLLFSYISYALLDFSETGATLYLMHTLQVQQF